MDRTRTKPNHPPIKFIVIGAVLACVVVAGSVTLASIDFGSKRVDHDRLSIEKVRQGTLEVKVSANGQLLPKNVEYIASQIVGRVAKAHVKPGDVVQAGQVLVELTNPELNQSAEEAHSAWVGAVTELKSSAAQLETNLLNQEVVRTQAKFDLQRAQVRLEAEEKLLGEHIIAEIDYKRDKLTVEQLNETLALEDARLKKMRDNVAVEQAVKQARVTELARALDRAKNQVSNLQIVAGISGIVQAIGVDIGQQLQAGSPIGRIAQLDQLYAELRVPAREANDLRTGQTVLVDTRNGTVNGTVTRVDPAVTDGTVIVDADLTGELPAGSRPQLQVEGTIYISQIPNALYVGKPAYVKANATIAVYKLDPAGRYASRVMIKTGKLSVNYLQILQGLQAGDQIITSDTGEWQHKESILIN
jgi:HlyD family secretion protein